MQVNNELVKQARSGDSAAFEALYTQIYKDLYRYAYYMMNNREDAEDMVSETVMDVYRTLPSLKDETKFCNWVITILSNKCKMKRKQYALSPVAGSEELLQDVKVEAQDVEQRRDLEMAIQKLDEQERNIVLMSVFGGLKSREIGECLHEKPTTIRSKLSRALGKMQGYLEVRQV